MFLPVVLVFLFNVSANLLNLYKASYDAYTHVFFASHYMCSWFDLWETRWYGGFPITSYPPLIHQLMALVGLFNGNLVDGAEIAYQLLCILSAPLFVFSMYKAALIFLDKTEAKYVAGIASLLPSLYLTLYVYGQLPTIYASSFSFLAAYTLYRFLQTGKIMNLAYTSLLSVLVASSHHFTFVFFYPIVLALTLIRAWKSEGNFKSILKRLILAFFVSAIPVLIVMEPFFEFVFRAPFQVEIPHATRLNIFADYSHSLLFFWGIYGFTVALIPVAFLIARKRTELYPLLEAFSVLFIMGLGGVAPIPKAVLGNLWYILTYDRFAVWASFLFIYFLGMMLKDAGQIMEKYSKPEIKVPSKLDRKTLKAGLLLSLAASSVFTLSFNWFLTPQPIPEPILQEVGEFLDKNEGYRYVTFGLGPSFMKLSAMCSAETIDGGYNSARQLKVLVNSGVERIDNAKFFMNATGFLDALLDESNSTAFGIKWVIVADKFYKAILMKHGYRKMNTLRSDPTIEIWTKDSVTMNETPHRENFNQYQVAVWGFGPISTLTAVAIIYIGSLLKYDEKTRR